jgi:hypothetical protein
MGVAKWRESGNGERGDRGGSLLGFGFGWRWLDGLRVDGLDERGVVLRLDSRKKQIVARRGSSGDTPLARERWGRTRTK